jgi:hypothetical protein
MAHRDQLQEDIFQVVAEVMPLAQVEQAVVEPLEQQELRIQAEVLVEEYQQVAMVDQE